MAKASAKLAGEPGTIGEAAPARPAPARLGSLAPVERRTVQDRVYAALRTSLIEGSFDPGEILRIQEVAARLETSTMPVREALARLISERALEALPNRSVRVPLLTRERLDDVAHARALIEGEAVARAAAHLGRADLDALRRLTRAYDATMRRAGSHAERAACNHAFHFRIYGAAGSKVLIPIIESLWLQSGPFIRASAEIYGEDGGLSATHHHWSIVEALEDGDAAAARTALEADISRAFDLLRARIGPGSGT